MINENRKKRIRERIFRKLYKLKLEHELNKVEEYRKKVHNELRYYNFKIAFSILPILTIFSLPILMDKIPLIFLFVYFFIAAIIFNDSYSIYEKKMRLKDDYRKHIKNKIMPIISQFFNYDICNGGITRQELSSSELFNQGLSEIIRDDSFSGNYKGIDFTITELEFKNFTEVSTIKDFKGVFILFKLKEYTPDKIIIKAKNKKIKLVPIMDILIVLYALLFIVPLSIMFFFLTKAPNGFYSALCLAITFIACLIAIVKYIEKREKRNVYLEDYKFMDKYKVISENQFEARKLLTPIIIENLNNIGIVLNSQQISFSIYDNNFAIAIETDSNLFEIEKINKPINNYTTAKQIFNELSAIYDLIDYLNIDKKIY